MEVKKFIELYNSSSEVEQINMLINMPTSGKMILIQQLIAEINLLTDDKETCESCEKKFPMETMESDSAGNWFCPECWAELAPIMKAEYEELVSKGEIEK